ncbi:colanic acid exporter [Salmonella enterica subsp. enterica]|uniref:Colanic acid exporter n=1 Tax=Salmonella enterica I TaxID=59201 RepID=A0A3S4LUN4_SALET|nr:colanic acid exporter [Salmonella enterica subsp. enterica]
MSLRQKTISGAKWSAIATIVIIGLGLIQMTVLARIIDNHQFGLLDRLAGDYRAGRHDLGLWHRELDYPA